MTDQKREFLAEKMDETEAKATAESARKKHLEVLKVGRYTVGSVALFAIACVTLPTIISNISGALYKSSLKKANHDDDWGLVIERKK